MLFNSWRRNILINQSILKPSQRTLAYKFQQVDKKWQHKWSSEPPTEHPNPSPDNKLYVLGQFPYPSGNIHMGHVRVYTICDVLTRYYKSKGRQVINPMGWDSFGLPAENAAIQRNIHPKPWTAQNIQDMKAQLVRMGFVFDWDRELATHEPAYYKHTQEIFSMLYKHGLAYKKDAYVNWDPVDQTVLANEQIDDKGRSWRSGAIVEKKLLRQWFLNIRKYADEMLDDLNHLDKWNETVKESQRGWIGKSHGAKITFTLSNLGSELPLTVFTTRPDTLYGVTFVAIAHDSPFVQDLLKSNDNNQADANAYKRYLDQIASWKQAGTLEHNDEGLLLRFITAKHPLTGQDLPVYLTTYILNDYGTGAIMGVPYHDERDCTFALKNQIEMIQVIDGDEDNDLQNCTLVNSGRYTGMKVPEASDKIINELEERGVGKQTTEFRLRDWLVSRQRYWGVPIPIVFCDNCGEVPLSGDQLPLLLPESGGDMSFLKKGQPLSHLPDFFNCKCPNCQGPARREVDTLDTFVDSSWYFLRFLDSQNGKLMFDIDKVKKWMPVDIYVGGMEHAIMHLLYARFIHKFLCDVNGIKHEKGGFNIMREPFKELIVQGLVKGKTYKLKENGKYVFPDEIGQFEDDKLDVTFEKMSKSKGNGVLPDTMADKFGVDTLRFALMFGAPPEADLNFDENFLQSMKSFLDKVSKQADKFASFSPTDTAIEINTQHSDKLQQVYELLVDYETKINTQRFFHVALARLMELNNLLPKIKDDSVRLLAYLYLIQALYPFTPHLSSEIWEQLNPQVVQLGFQSDIARQKWDDFGELLRASRTTVKVRVSIDGKFMGIIEVPQECMGDAQRIFGLIKEHRPKDIKKVEQIAERRSLEEFKKVIVQEGKPMINFITQ